MSTNHALPYTTRAATVDDIPHLSALDAAHTRHAVGRALRTEGEIRTEWKAPFFDPETDSRVVVDANGRLVAWCEVYDSAPHVRIPSRLRLDPELNDPSVARQLIKWSQDRALQSISKAPETARVILTQAVLGAVPEQIGYLEEAGFRYTRSFLRMQIEMTEVPPEPIWPEGITVRPLNPGVDDRAAVMASREVFRDHWGHVETPFEEDLAEWQQWIHEDEDFDTDLWFLAMDSDEIAGFCQCYPTAGDCPKTAQVDELGVRRQWRGRGLALALLLHAFGTLYRRGKTTVNLGVDADSLTGATRLYERAGMHLAWETRVHELELRPGVDTMVRDTD